MTAPKPEEDQKRDEVLRRMLNMPHKRHEPLKAKAKKRRANAKKGAK